MDSPVVLSWLRGNPRRYKPFVGNWVSEMLSLMPTNTWQHVSSNDNPADSASRQLFPSDLMSHHIWWNGPSWLCDDKSNWPETPQIDDVPEMVKKRSPHLCWQAKLMYYFWTRYLMASLITHALPVWVIMTAWNSWQHGFRILSTTVVHEAVPNSLNTQTLSLQQNYTLLKQSR